MTNYDNNPEFNAHAPGESSSTAMAIVVAALVLVVGAFLYFSNSSTAPNGQQLTGNQVTPAPSVRTAPLGVERSVSEPVMRLSANRTAALRPGSTRTSCEAGTW